MSKQKNTLFNYFTSPPGSNKTPAPSPTVAKTPSSTTPLSSKTKTPASKTPVSSAKKVKIQETTPVSRSKKVKRDSTKPVVEDDVDKENASGDEQSVAPPKKRRRILVIDDEDSGDEYKPDKKDAVSSESESSGVESDASNDGAGTESEDETPKKAPARRGPSKPSASPAASPAAVSAATKAKLSALAASPATARQSNGASTDAWTHLSYDFLKPEKIRDAAGKQPDHPDYDPRTLLVKEDFKNSCTPGMRQWWEIRSKHNDCVIFFKVGKFYELYHMDAVIGVNELGLTYMKGDKAHSGFPEIAYGRFSSSLVRKGFKVIRVEQTETPDMMAERCKKTGKSGKWDKIMRREICQIMTAGTQTFGAMEGNPCDSSENFLLAITEKSLDAAGPTFGVCFVDTSIGVFHLGQFQDDRHSSCLRTLLAHHPPVQILFERGSMSPTTQKLLNATHETALRESLKSGSEFWPADETVKALAEGEYFKQNGRLRWPDGLRPFLSDGESDSMCLTAGSDSELAVSALGACVWYLRQCHLDQQVLAMQLFQTYVPLAAEDATLAKRSESDLKAKHLVLDSITLGNLDILYHGNERKQGTLLHTLDFTVTPFGKRLLRQWLCSPVCEVSAIVSRQTAIKDLLDNPHLMADAREKMKTLPDLERLLSKIHTQGNAVRSATHPDSRAIFYDDRKYSKLRIQDFLSALAGFKTALEVAALFTEEKDSLSSKMLATSMCIKGESPQGRFPNLTESLEFFETAFDHDEAVKEGRIIPRKGVDEDYDAVNKEIAALQKRQDQYLEEQRKFFQGKVVYVGTGRNRLQLEVADGMAKRATSRYELQGQRKGYRRFWTPECRDLIAKTTAAEDTKSSVLRDLSRRIFKQFSDKYDEWSTVLNSLATLDVLASLAQYARNQEGETCVPQFALATASTKPFVSISSGRHPCVDGGADFVPNDTEVGGDSASLLLLTGPNMGGKSTLMRQLGLIVVMAHLGCHVPASACRLSPVDRVFTRLGAEDDIAAGESTFFVELSETAALLSHATQHSLALVDELGRGTSTHDGSAIASAVARALADAKCRTLFSTHYHTLVDDFRGDSHIALGHMACMVENEDDADGGDETVTFLYKLASGACPKSYGFNAARLAGLPADIVRRGRAKAAQLEREASDAKAFRGAWNAEAGRLAELLANVTCA